MARDTAAVSASAELAAAPGASLALLSWSAWRAVRMTAAAISPPRVRS